jgi:hypothetical protein
MMKKSRNIVLLITALTLLSLILIEVPFAQAALPGNALSFDGVDDYVSVPYSSSLAPGTLSVSAWVCQNDWASFTDSGIVVSKTENGGYALDFNYPTTGGGAHTCLFWICRPSGYTIITAPIGALSSGWHHFAGTYDGQFVKLYIDGVEKASTDCGSTANIRYLYSNALFIGAEPGTGSSLPWDPDFFVGKLDEVQIFKRALTATEVATQYNAGNGNYGYPLDGLVGGWHFDEASGATYAADYSDNNNQGTIHGATIVPGKSLFVLPEYPLGGLLAVMVCFGSFAALRKLKPAKLLVR